MIIQGREVPNGWPFGLGNMNMNFGARESVEAVVDAIEPNTFHGPTSSFSSFSSSNLDTESTVSFFHDNSVSLGRLIGLKPRDNGTLYFTRTSCIREQRSQLSESSSKAHENENSHGVCVPNLLNILVKMSRSKSHSR